MLLPYQEIVIWSFVLALIVTLVHRFLVNPDEMRQIKKDIKYLSKKSREAQKNKETEKANKYMSEMMSLNKKQFGLMKKPLVIIFLVYGIALYTIFVPYGQTNILTGQYSGGILVNTENQINEYTRTGTLEYAGLSHPLQVTEEKYTDEYGNEQTRFNVNIDSNNNGDFSDNEILNKYDVTRIGDSSWLLQASSLDQTFFVVAVPLPFTLPFFGENLSWIWWYIIVIITMSTVLRKLIGVE